MNKAAWLRIVCILFALCAATATASPAQILTTLHSFTGYPNDGAGLDSAVTRGSDGNYYGTTGAGGDNCYPSGCGTFFKITPDGTETTLYSFGVGTDGAEPYGALVQGTDGNFYGTTSGGGANGAGGTVFKITPSGTLTTLYSFCSQPNCADGALPGGLVLATDGNFYGVTGGGGSNNCTDDGCGTIFKITPSGTLTTLYTFCPQGNCPNGYGPDGLIQATDGNFYGATGYGGASGNGCDGDGCGTIFTITPSGSLTTLYSFCTQTGCPDGQFPNGQMVQAGDGNFYGTTREGGANCSENGTCGTVFKITSSGALTTLHSFCLLSRCADGAYPVAAPVQATDGNFYGTTYGGGAYLNGTVYKITPNGALTTLYSFCPERGCDDGEFPAAALLPAPDDEFYGSTGAGGTSNDGTVFRLTVPRTCTVCRNAE
jgi:uncharacterized repeat protein (TIGR03803 family)